MLIIDKQHINIKKSLTQQQTFLILHKFSIREQKKVFKLQKRAIRNVTNAAYNAHTEPLFRRLGILKLQDLRSLFELKFYHNHCNNKLPEYFSSYVTRNRDFHSHSTRMQTHLYVPTHRHQFFKMNLRYSLVETVNSCPEHLLSLTQTHSLKAFTFRAKKHLLQTYDPQVPAP